MPAETSSAPEVLWAVIDPGGLGKGHANADGILPTGLVEHTTDGDRARSRAQYRDEAMNRTRPERKHLAVEYVRKDVSETAREYRCRASCRGVEHRADGEVVTVVEEVDEDDGISLPHETREPAERTRRAVERNGWAEDVWIESRVVGPWERDDQAGGADHGA